VRVRSARFLDSRHARSATVPIAGPSPIEALVVASRAAFDAALLGAARRIGAATVSARATRIERSRAGFAIHTADRRTITARVLVGADGTNSLVRRTVLRPFARRQLSIATGFYAHGATGEEIVIEFVGDPPGYIWSFPRPDHLAIGICAAADSGVTPERLRHGLVRWIEANGLAPGCRLEPYSWPIPSLTVADLRSLAIAGDGWCLVGDAAGLVDPITREGIFFALRSAEAAAAAIAGSAAATIYRDRVQSEVIGELARAARLKTGFFRPRFTTLLIDALQQSASIRAVMARLIAGTQSYRGLQWELARTLEIGLALRAIGLRWSGTGADRSVIDYRA
jgi:flavin-dependent dehydrogenase